jgi:aspartate dehydrogenase
MTADAGPQPLRVGIIGFGRIGRRIAEHLDGHPGMASPVAILAREAAFDEARVRFGGHCAVASLDDLLARRPDIVLECASAQILAEAGPKLLAAGTDLLPLSLSTLADPAVETRLMKAAEDGPGRLELAAGAVGGLGLIAAAKLDGLTRLRFHQSYPASIWRGTAAAGMIDLDRVATRTRFFDGTAREAARLFPRNLNVSVGVALAGLGLDRTEVSLWVDPAIAHATYAIELDAGPGSVRLEIGHRAVAEGEDPADYTAFSVMRLLHRRQSRIMI